MDATDNVVHIERVRCLECGTTYSESLIRECRGWNRVSGRTANQRWMC